MKQVCLNERGEIVVRQTEDPKVGNQFIVTDTTFSIISTGTETMGIRAARKSSANQPGLTPLGYTNSGCVTAVGSGVDTVSTGDRVGAYGSSFAQAGHASKSKISKHLCVKLPDNVSLRSGAFLGLGGIAMQAVRRADLRLGETVVVLGLGVLGQIVARIFLAGGQQVFGCDFLQMRADTAAEAGVCIIRPGEVSVDELLASTDGHGADAVVICVATDSAEPIAQALKMLRFGGRIVVVGVAQIELDRSLFFGKEAQVLISRAAGPGRYDPSYERDGEDLPYPYVRWSEGRNLAEFIRLLHIRQVEVESLITHEFSVDEAPEAYEQVMEHPGETLAVALKYRD
ncbi:MAG: zinc-binding alcohol dehydrogenase [Armatimonadetes bacterium]|nr:zinc-binding alcohol dehydrogenase [Armatimonadota bacterium]